MRTTGTTRQHAALMQTAGEPGASSHRIMLETQTYSLADQVSQIASNPVSAGMRGLLLVGAVTAALLAILGSIIQALLATQQRARQFAVMRTVGMSGRQLTLVLLGEQVIVYLFGLLGGTLLGLVLVTATLPFLQFSDTTINPATGGHSAVRIDVQRWIDPLFLYRFAPGIPGCSPDCGALCHQHRPW